MMMELIEGSETSAIRTQTPENYPKENTLHIEHGESLKSRNYYWLTERKMRILVLSTNLS